MKKKIDLEHIKSTRKLRRGFIGAVAIVILLALVVSISLEYLLISLNVIKKEEIEVSLFWVFFIMGLTSVITGTILFIFASKILLKPIDVLLDGLNKLEKGEYDTQIEIKAIPKISNSFNSLAKELKNVQILRSDFINNFSHEFKTPIVSIKGLIGLMKNRNVTKEKQLEYFDIIDDEINRLSLITTNVLHLSKLDNQEILTEINEYNLSEQIRRCVLLTERQWRNKNLTIKVDFEEFKVRANEDMLKQVWINLLDNAIKFSYENTEIEIDVKKQNNTLAVSFKNHGVPISNEDKDKIFNKFYQADESYAKSGNGIGLSIVKKIIELHKGSVKLNSQTNKTEFTVTIPCF
ncbi:MAG: HAMP domain-containing histidine kinase [Clostridia bacterium]|nr:HAMP domain-containing histidine kinase [Clostridia bacterium]